MCLPCPVCNQQTFDSCVAMLKRLIQVANDSLICPVCRETFIGLDKFTIHLFSHTDHKSEPDTEELTKISRTKIKCDARSPANRENGGIQCDTCGFYFENSSTLEMHTKLIHNSSKNNDKNGNSKYPCHLCSKSFKMRGSLMVHLRMVHFGIVPPLGKQEKLEAGIDNEEVGESIKDPPAAISESNVKQWSCDICKKSFTTKYFLKKHKRLHTGEMPYTCNQCGKMFTFQQSYHKHLLYHNDEKPHACNQCGRTFKELSTLHNHQRIHTGEKPFSCETCGKSFRQRVSYLVHKRIHTGIMPYKCTACDKSFRHKVSQRTHKCTAQPPGIVIRQPYDLVEKLKKNQSIVNNAIFEMNEKGKDKNVSNSQIVAETATLKCLKQNNKYKLSDKSSNTTELENYHDKPNYLDPFNIGSTTSIQKDSYSYQAENILDEIVEESIKKIQQDTMTTHNDFYPPITDFYSMVSPQHIPENVPSPSEKLKKLSLYCNESDFELNINNNFFEKVNEPNINRVSGEKYDSLSFEDGFSKKVYS